MQEDNKHIKQVTEIFQFERLPVQKFLNEEDTPA